MEIHDLNELINDNDFIIEYMDNHNIGQKNVKRAAKTNLRSRKNVDKKRDKKRNKRKKHEKNNNYVKRITSSYHTYDNTPPKSYPSKKDAYKFKECIGNESYRSDKNGLTVIKSGSNSDKILFISNVVPFATKQIYEHKDSGETISSLEIGIHGKDLPPFKILASDLSNSGYMANHLPHGVIIKDYYRFSSFVKCMAEKANLCHLYNYIGFTEENSYVHSGGVISAEQRNNTRSELGDGSLTLRHHPVSSKKIVSCLDELFGLEPATTMMVSFTLLSLCYSQHKQERPEFVFLLYGSSGTFKTTLSMHIFNIFEENYTSPPTNLKVATEASIHRLMGRFRDSVLLVDDAAPSVSGNDETYKKCESIVRAVGDGTGRMVAGRDSKINVYKPSGLIAITGEFVPLRDTSSISRCIMYKFEKGCIDPEKLSEIQQKKCVYIQFIINYICWICDNNRDKYIKEITELHTNHRNKLRKKLSKIHSRFPNNMAWIYSGFDMLCKFASEIYSVSDDTFKQWHKTFETAVERVVKEEKMYLKQQNDSKLFIETVNSLIRSHQVDLAAIIVKEKNKKTAIETPNNIGYYDDSYVYLKPEMAYAVTNKWLHNNIQSGYSLPLQALLNSLKEQKFIIPDSDGRPKSRLCLSGNRMRVIKLDKKKYFANV